MACHLISARNRTCCLKPKFVDVYTNGDTTPMQQRIYCYMADERSYHVETLVTLLRRHFQVTFADVVQKMQCRSFHMLQFTLSFISSRFLPLIVATRYSKLEMSVVMSCTQFEQHLLELYLPTWDVIRPVNRKYECWYCTEYSNKQNSDGLET
jgi:hypothetical protein